MFRFGALTFAALVAIAAPGCASDYMHDAAAFYPADFEASYAKVADCALSGSHGNKYVVVYANPSAETALKDAAVTEYPQGAVFVKAQFDASDCSGAYSNLTAMRKDAPGSGTASDWKWQAIADSGEIDGESYDMGGCIGCHQSQSGGKDLVLTE